MRRSGVLLAISSLASKYGIGCFSKEAYDFVDFLEKAGQSYWQILPLGATGYGDSPYQSFSTFAGNPYFINLEYLINQGWLSKKECDIVSFSDTSEYVNYEKIYKGRTKLLRKAFTNSKIEQDSQFVSFCKKEADWLNDYALFMAIKDAHQGQSFLNWEANLRLRKPKALQAAKLEYAEEIKFYCFLQYLFETQWIELKTYANEHGVKIIGDIPIYVALDSADAWAHPELFCFDEDKTPIGVAGCPPDYFAATGQLWGNPLYDWDYHNKTGFKWWLTRMSRCYKLYDVVRIDHFRGFDEYYHIPYGDPTAEYGHWEKGPGYDLFQTLGDTLGDQPVIAEDLGFLTPSVLELVKRTGYPGMKVLEFAFDSREDNDYLPHNYEKNCVVYTGTHDNDTVLGWYDTLPKKDRRFLRKYLGIRNGKKINWDLIRTASASVADTVIIPMQDYLGLGSEARMNTPSTLGFNWQWRLLEGQCTDELATQIYELAKVYGRVWKK